MNSTEPGVKASEFQPALAARFYASESVFALERERLFHAQWFCVGRAEQVLTRGECLHVHVAGESVLILRQKDDSLRAFYNVCRHRGSRLVQRRLCGSDQPSATCSTSLSAGVVCPYHAWTTTSMVAARGTLRAVRSTCPKEGFHSCRFTWTHGAASSS
jgi:phenylpropionate dioxygenase-like ring-hydroxylating dioxygenase large terminal subunit